MEIPSHKSLFVEMYFKDTLLASGTATLIANDRESHCALVTARHNVTGRHQDTGECLSKHAAVPDSILIHFHGAEELVGSKWKPIRLPLYRDDGSPFWIEHPRLGARADIAALNLSWGKDVTRYPYYLKGDLDNVNLDIGPAETVSVIGFPFGVSKQGKISGMGNWISRSRNMPCYSRKPSVHNRLSNPPGPIRFASYCIPSPRVFAKRKKAK